METAKQKGYQRRATLLLYLNDVPEGGATKFDIIDIGVQPVKGDALLFFPSFQVGVIISFVPKRKSLDASAYFGPGGGSQFEGYPLPSSRLGSSLLCGQHFPRLPSRNALTVGAPTLFIRSEGNRVRLDHKSSQISNPGPLTADQNNQPFLFQRL
jgi:hypothetical protein